MFWISKKKVFWKDLWENGFIDIHNHLLWGIDDGSKSLEETIILCNAMQELGITEAIATPHTYPGLWNNSTADLTTAYANYCSSVDSLFIKNVASEYLADVYLEHLMEQKTLVTLPGGYVLVEFSMLFAPSERIMLAHTERYLYWKNNLSAFERLKNFDLYFQMNSLSILGYYGNDVKKLCQQLLDLEMYDFMGTDTHRIEHILFTKEVPLKIAGSNCKQLEGLIQSNRIFSTSSF